MHPLHSHQVKVFALCTPHALTGVESKGDDGDVDDVSAAALPAALVVLPAAASGAAALAGNKTGAALRRDMGGVSPEVCECPCSCAGFMV